MKDKFNEIEISYKESIPKPFWKKIKSSKDASEFLYQHWNKNTIEAQESFKVILLNNSNKIKGVFELSIGGITATTIDMRILFAVVLKTLSVAIILTHNHPSGKLEASKADIQLTKEIKKAAALFNVKVLDHLIIAPNGDYYSFADNHMI